MTDPLPWRPDRLLKILLVWTAFTTLIFWLPTVRGAFDGDSYAWSVLGFSGHGLHGAYIVPVIGSLFAFILLWSGWRGTRRPFPWLLGSWHGFLAVGITVVVLQDPEGFHVKGDSAGLDIDLAMIGPAFFGAWALLALWWIVRHHQRKHSPVPAWTRGNTRRLLVLVTLLPVQFALLRSGAMDSVQDLIGVGLTVIQWLALGAALAPRPTPSAP